MGWKRLLDANRELLRAIETPPETGREEQLDRLAATLWSMAIDTEPPTTGRLTHIERSLIPLQSIAQPARAAHLRRARELIDQVQRSATVDRSATPPDP